MTIYLTLIAVLVTDYLVGVLIDPDMCESLSQLIIRSDIYDDCLVIVWRYSFVGGILYFIWRALIIYIG